MSDQNRNVRSADEPVLLEALLRRRFSCRAFLPDPLPRERIDHMLRLAQRTASWCNAQPWHVAIVSGPAIDRFRSALLAHVQAPISHDAGTDACPPDFPFPARYAGIYAQRRRATAMQLYDAVGVTGDRAGSARQTMENFRLFGAPHVAIVSAPDDLGPYGAVDCGGYVATLLLAAEALGIAAIPQAAIAHHAQFVRTHIGLAPDRRIVCAVSFGRADPDHPANGFRTDRASLDEAVSWIDA